MRLAAQRFLKALDPSAATWTFQTFDDDAERKDRSLAVILHGTLEQHLEKLTELSERGAGVFVMVNVGDGRGRAKANVLTVRALYVDLDGAPLEHVLSCGLPPHAIVATSPGKWHAYWRVSDCPLDQFKTLQQAMIRRFGSDPAVCDLPRVMRLPGCAHQKDAACPFKVELIEARDIEAYKLADIVSTLGLMLDDPAERKPIAGVDTEEALTAGARHGALMAYGGRLRELGTSRHEILDALRAVNARRCEPPKSDAELREMTDYLAKKTPGDDRLSGVDATALEYIDAADLLERPVEDTDFLVRHLAPAASVILLSGDTGSAKTAFATHLVASIATKSAVAGRFEVASDARPVLYLNGEMAPSLMLRYLREALAGIGVAEIERGRIIFQGLDGVATFKLSGETAQQLVDLVADIRPALVVLDTQRALLVGDENDGTEVRRAFSWLREHIVNAFGTAVLICHHLRKIGQTSNSDRERVSGSRDILASVDVHLAAISRGEAPMHALRIGKTRYPADGVAAGTEWPIEARYEFGRPSEVNRSIFVAGEIGDVSTSVSRSDEATTTLLALFEIGEPISRSDAQATAGNPKRAWDKLASVGSIVCVGKRGREKLYALAEVANNEPGQAELVRDPATRKALSGKETNRVTVRPVSRPEGSPEAASSGRPEGDAYAEPREPGHGSTRIGNRDRDPVRNGPARIVIAPDATGRARVAL